jgi:hypothetical protein
MKDKRKRVTLRPTKAEREVEDVKWLTTKECVALLSCSSWAFQNIVREGLIRKREFGGYRRYWRLDVERLALPPDGTL